MSFDNEILCALYNVAVENGVSGGYRLSQFMPEGCTLLDARAAAKRLFNQGYIEMPQGMTAGPIVCITWKGCERAQLLMT